MAGTEPLMTRTLDAGRRRVQWQESVRKTHDSTGFRAVRSSRLGSTEMHRHERGGMEMGGDGREGREGRTCREDDATLVHIYSCASACG